MFFSIHIFSDVPNKVAIGKPEDQPLHTEDLSTLKIILKLMEILVNTTCSNKEMVFGKYCFFHSTKTFKQ